MQSIFAKLLYEMEKRHDTVLVTIIHESGSTPRGEGAQMLVGAQGPLGGTIGGGNVENLSILHARDLIARRCSDLHEYPLHRSDTEDIGMVCGGDVTALFTFIPGTDAAWAALAADLLQHIADRQPGYLALPLDGTVGFLTDDPEKDGFFTMPLSIGERAILFGAGHCSLALTPVLRSVGFRVTVFDDRPELITPDRFPAAERLICGDFSHIDRYLSCSTEDYIVVMTSGHTHDFIVQEQILRRDFAYVGVIGSRAKTASVNARLRAAGVQETAIASVHTPVGVAIKAVTPEEIAVSIAGEMICERALRREKDGPRHHGCPMH